MLIALLVAVLALLAVATAAAVSRSVGVAAPLILVVLGIGVSLLPIIPEIEIDPEWILAGVLPPLLYSTAVAMPTMNFRREFTSISGLSIVLVLISTVVLGVFFAWVIPGLGLWWGLALGAIVSPTDAVATSIVKRSGVSGRVVSVLEGESLLNDASALVLLRIAIVGTAATVTFWDLVGSFGYAVTVAVAFGLVVGHLNLWVRARVREAAVNTVISFTVAFLASIPTELLGASGLVAAVVAGLVTGRGAARHLPPQHRLSDTQNWHVIELVLEGVIFLVMGLELAGILAQVEADHRGVGVSVLIGIGALILTLVVRVVYVTPLLIGLRRRRQRHIDQVRPRLDEIHERLNGTEPDAELAAGFKVGPIRHRQPDPDYVERIRTRTRRAIADIDYFLSAPLGWREGGILVWAGMRGAITVAAAQTLSADTPDRSMLVLIAFTVAATSLIVQGGTLEQVVRWIRPLAVAQEASEGDERKLAALLDQVATEVRQSPRSPDSARSPQLRLITIAAQRAALLDARDEGQFSAQELNRALAKLDADQISIELHARPPDP